MNLTQLRSVYTENESAIECIAGMLLLVTSLGEILIV